MARIIDIPRCHTLNPLLTGAVCESPFDGLPNIKKEELERLREAGKSYQRELKRLPRGSIQRKKIGKAMYPYLVFRQGKRVVSQYLGRLSSEELARLRDGIQLRRRYERLLRDVRQNATHVEKMIQTLIGGKRHGG